jgi:hypothetical protein
MNCFVSSQENLTQTFTIMTMLEYSKMILEKVSFEPRIFKKELRKALRQSTKEEFHHLMSWCREKFGKKKQVSKMSL